MTRNKKQKAALQQPINFIPLTEPEYTCSYIDKRREEVGDDLEVCPQCGGIIFRCFEDGSGKCGDCGVIYPSKGEEDESIF